MKAAQGEKNELVFTKINIETRMKHELRTHLSSKKVLII
jgi:hypothetical protein